MTVPPDMDTPGFESTPPYVYYQNGAAVLESTNIKPYHLRYLKGLRVVSFAGASQLLGIESHIEFFASYSEFADQRIHSRMLFLNRVDVVLADGLIFSEINHRLRADRTYADKADLHQKVMFIPIFAPPTPYRASFRKKKNTVMHSMRASVSLKQKALSEQSTYDTLKNIGIRSATVIWATRQPNAAISDKFLRPKSS